jgi:hypothetical protein
MDKIPAKLFLTRIKLDRQGYESNGCYWGVGAPSVLRAQGTPASDMPGRG